MRLVPTLVCTLMFVFPGTAAGADVPSEALVAAAAQLGLSPQEFERRTNIQAEAWDAAQIVNERPNEYGGAYFEADGDWYGLTVRYVAESDRSIDLKTSAPVRWMPTTHTASSLEALAVAVDKGESERGNGMVFVAADITRDQILVRIEKGDAVAMAADLTKRYGVSVRAELSGPVQGDACLSRSDCDDWRGGIEVLLYQGGVSKSSCTWGFQGKIADGTRQMITAGHCGFVGSTFKHASDLPFVVIGSVDMNGLDTRANFDFYDVSRTTIDGAGLINPRNRIYYDNAYKSLPVVSAPTTYGSLPVGATIYRVGKNATEPAVGTVMIQGGYLGDVANGQSAWLAGYYCNPYNSCNRKIKVWEADFAVHAIGGDSGGPIFTVNWFNGTPVSASYRGTHSSHGYDDHYFTWAPDAAARLNITSYCLTDAC